jgi:hypothetical protein
VGVAGDRRLGATTEAEDDETILPANGTARLRAVDSTSAERLFAIPGTECPHNGGHAASALNLQVLWE